MTTVEWASGLVGRPFEWGRTNCVALALQAIDDQLGTTLFTDYAPAMASARKAAAWTKRNGLDGMLDILRAAGCRDIVPSYAFDGDIIYAVTDDGQISAHVVAGTRVLSSDPEHGVAMYSLGAVLANARGALTCRP